MKKITKELVDKIIKDVKEGIDIEVAATSHRVNPTELFAMRQDGIKPNAEEMSAYVAEELTVAEAEAEKAIVKKWINGDTYQSKAAMSFLETTNSKYSKRHRLRLEYEANIMLDVVKQHVTEEQFNDIMVQIAGLNNVQCVLPFDEFLLKS